MGVTGLWKVVNAAGKIVSLEDLRGKTLAIDTSIWITKYASVFSSFTKKQYDETSKRFTVNTNTDLQKRILSALFKRICKLLYFNVKPIFVFDGATPEMKSRTLEIRRVHRATATERRNAKNRQRLLQSFIAKQLAEESGKPVKQLKQTSVDMFVRRTGRRKDDQSDLRRYELSDSHLDEPLSRSESEIEISSRSSSSSDVDSIDMDLRAVRQARTQKPESDSDCQSVHSASEDLFFNADAGVFSRRHISRIIRRELSKREREQELEQRVLRRTGIEDAERLLSAARSSSDRVMVLVRTKDKSNQPAQEENDEAQRKDEPSSSFQAQEAAVEVNSATESDVEEVHPITESKETQRAAQKPSQKSPNNVVISKQEPDAVMIESDVETSSSTSTEGLVEVDTEFELATQRAIELSRVEAVLPQNPIIRAPNAATSTRKQTPRSPSVRTPVASPKERSPETLPKSPDRSQPTRNSSERTQLNPSSSFSPTQSPSKQQSQVGTEHGELERALQMLLSAFGIPFIRARAEADAECALLNRFGLADGVLTEDGDCLLLGARTVYRNVFDPEREPLRFDSAAIRQSCALSRARLVFYALLAGCDYSSGLRGCGAGSALCLARHFVPLPVASGAGRKRKSSPEAVDTTDETDVTETLREATARLREAMLEAGNASAPTSAAARKSDGDDKKVRSVLRKLATASEANANLVNERALFAFGDPLREAGERNVQEYISSRRAVLQWSVPNLDELRRVGTALLSLPSATLDAFAIDAIRHVREFEALRTQQQMRITDFTVTSPSKSSPSPSLRARRSRVGSRTRSPSPANTRLPVARKLKTDSQTTNETEQKPKPKRSSAPSSTRKSERQRSLSGEKKPPASAESKLSKRPSKKAESQTSEQTQKTMVSKASATRNSRRTLKK